MRLNIPFVGQDLLNDCIPSSIYMIFKYFGDTTPKSEIQELCEMDESGVIWTIGAVKAVSILRYRVEFYTTALSINPENYDLEFYKNNADNIKKNIQKIEKLKKIALKNGAILEEKKLNLKKILSKINENCVPIILLDWGIVENWKDKHPIHAVPITGYDDEFVYINEPGRNKKKDYKIKRDVFDKARKAPGTDEDIMFIYKK